MVKKTLMCFILVMMSLAVHAQTTNKTSGSAEKAVTGLEQQWVAAARTGNIEFIAALVADNFRSLDSDGTTHNKTEYLGWLKGIKWEINEISDVKVTAFGGTVVAIGAWRGKGVGGDGKSIDAHERYMDTWMKMPNGKWQCIASASAPAKM